MRTRKQAVPLPLSPTGDMGSTVLSSVLRLARSLFLVGCTCTKRPFRSAPGEPHSAWTTPSHRANIAGKGTKSMQATSRGGAKVGSFEESSAHRRCSRTSDLRDGDRLLGPSDGRRQREEVVCAWVA